MGQLNFLVINLNFHKKDFIIFFKSFFLLITIFLEMPSLGLVTPFFSIILDYQGSPFLNNLINYVQVGDRETLIIISTTILIVTYLFKNILIYFRNLNIVILRSSITTNNIKFKPNRV